MWDEVIRSRNRLFGIEIMTGLVERRGSVLSAL